MRRDWQPTQSPRTTGANQHVPEDDRPAAAASHDDSPTEASSFTPDPPRRAVPDPV